MNHRLLYYIRARGYCCLWAWLKVQHARLTVAVQVDVEGVIQPRALRYQRKAYRDGQLRCEQCKECLLKVPGNP